MTLNIDSGRLRVVAAIQRAGSVHGAARALGITSSAVSQSLKALEATLELRLFDRIANRLRPTADARRLAELFDGFEAQLDDAIEQARAQKSEPRGTVRIGSASELGARLVIPALKDLASFDRVSFEVDFGVPEVLLRSLVDQRIDLAFCDDGPFLKKYRSLVAFSPVFEEELVLVASKTFARDFLRERTFTRLEALPHVDYVSDLSVLGLWYRHHFKRVPGALTKKLVTPHVQGVLAGVRAGLGLGMVPEYVIASELERGTLVKISPKKKELRHAVLLAQLADRVPTLAEKLVIEAVRGATT